jgi:hypothetical protein
MRFISQSSNPSCQKKDWMQIQHEQVDGISPRGRLRGQLGREDEMELLTAIHVCAQVTGTADVMRNAACVRVAQIQDSNAG